MFMANSVIAEPNTEADWVPQMIRNVRQPLGGGSYGVLSAPKIILAVRGQASGVRHQEFERS